jgi:hypothetical protein
MPAPTTFTETSHPHPDAARASEVTPLHLDYLLRLPAGKLHALYTGARAPRLSDVHGDLRGRMLAIPALTGPLAGLLHAWAASSSFPWLGKSFTPRSEDRGEGINRVLVDRFRLYRFETFVGKSRAGDFDAVQLNYDLPENPFFIRPIKDEIRELQHGLYLGQAWLEIGGRAPYLALYFALEARP